MKKNLNLPNALTFLRILMIPAVYITYYQLPERRWIALVIYLLASFTDFLDGYLARKWNQITSFGKLFDPLADKLIVLTVLYCLADTDYAHWWVFFLMLGKEILMVLGSLLMLGKKVVVKSNIYGKTATCLFIAAIALAFPWHNVAALFTVGHVLLYIALAASLVSMGIYAYQAVKIRPNA